MEFTAISQPVAATVAPLFARNAFCADGSSTYMQSGETVPSSPAVAFAVITEAAGPPTKRISPVFRDLCIVTVNAEW